MMKKLDSKNSSKSGLKSQTRQENTTKMKIWKITTAKFKCTREHILCHDWLIGHYINVRGLGKSMVVFRLFEKLR